MAAAAEKRPESGPTGASGEEPPDPGQPRAADGPPPPRWWPSVAALVAAVVLLVLAAFPPWPDVWVAGEFGSVPWWVAVPALLAVAAVTVGLGGRRLAWSAAAVALAAAGLAVFAVVREPSRDLAENPGWAEFLEPRAAAPLAAAFAAVLAAALCAVVARRGLRIPPATSGDTGSGRGARLRRALLADEPARNRGQRVLVVALAGALLGSLLSAGAGVGADRVQQAFLDEAPFRADAETVPRGEREDGHEVTVPEHIEPATDLGFEEVIWEDTLAGPAELTQCVLQQPEYREDGWVPSENRGQPLVTRGVLVALEETAGADAVVGYDPVDGAERWRYTVQDGEVELPQRDSDANATVSVAAPSRIGQVGVTDFCAVHVVVDPVSLVTLDAATGEVVGESRLPSMTSGAWTDETETRQDHWQFVTDSRPDDRGYQVEREAFDRLVALGAGGHVHLEYDGQLAEVHRETGELRALSEAESGCRFLTAYDQRTRAPGDTTVLTQNCGVPSHQSVPRLPGNSSDGHDGTSRLLADSHDVPLLGCEDRLEWPHVTDTRSGRWHLVLVGAWCDTFDSPLMVVIDEEKWEHEVVELPEGTELPLRPHLMRQDRSVVWLDRGTVYRYSYGVGGEELGVHELYADADGVAAIVPPEHDPDEHFAEGPRVFYAVTESGSVLKVEYGHEFDEPDDLASEVVEELDGVAGTCAGTRDLVLDRSGLTLLALCETEEGTEVTAVGAERLTEARGRSMDSSWRQY